MSIHLVKRGTFLGAAIFASVQELGINDPQSIWLGPN
jgi:hypothetical protein